MPAVAATNRVTPLLVNGEVFGDGSKTNVPAIRKWLGELGFAPCVPEDYPTLATFALHDVFIPCREHVYALADMARTYDIEVNVGE